MTTPLDRMYREQHPVGPVTGRDPLAAGWTPPPDGLAGAAGRPRLGYAAFWDAVPERTLSGAPWNLREALRGLTETVDLGVEFSSLTRLVLKAAHARYRDGRPRTYWNNAWLTDQYVSRSLRRRAGEDPGGGGLDAVVMTGTIATFREPFFTYSDTSWDSSLSSTDTLATYARMRGLTAGTVLRRRDRQLKIYERATGIIAFSHWLARSIVEQSGVSPDKVHVIHPGRGDRPMPGPVGGGESTTRRQARAHGQAPGRKLLYIGRLYDEADFYRKGGDLVAAAFAILRREYDPRLTLTMAGIEKWPLPGEPPEGVTLPGVVPAGEVGKLYDSHDLFVMPSRMEPFGFVFAEALGRGMPCVARNAYAMPEIVTPGVSGALIERDDPAELAAAIVAVLGDHGIYEQCAKRAPRIAEYFSWDRAGRQMVDLISRGI
jgi:glycosyltransferase involved in cell wall biosynthesis